MYYRDVDWHQTLIKIWMNWVMSLVYIISDISSANLTNSVISEEFERWKIEGTRPLKLFMCLKYQAYLTRLFVQLNLNRNVQP